MKVLKICFFLFGLFFLVNGKAQAQCEVNIMSLPQQVTLNADNSIDIPITIQTTSTTGSCELRLDILVITGEATRDNLLLVASEGSSLPTAVLQTTITAHDARVGQRYTVRCGSLEYGLNDGGCTVVVVPC